MYVKRAFVVFLGMVLLATACGGSDPVADVAPTATEAVVEAPTTAPVGATESTPAATEQAAATVEVVAPVVGEWPNRFCVDVTTVETTLNLRSGPSLDAEVLAAIPRFSCDLVLGGSGLDNNYQPVIYTTAAGAIDGWVSNDFIVFQDPPMSMEATALLMVDAWQSGVDTTQYTYDLDTLPTPITAGWPVPVDGPAGVGCVLVGDITIECAIALVERDGTEIARLLLAGSKRGVDGNDGPPYFADDFPDDYRVFSFEILDT